MATQLWASKFSGVMFSISTDRINPAASLVTELKLKLRGSIHLFTLSCHHLSPSRRYADRRCLSHLGRITQHGKSSVVPDMAQRKTLSCLHLVHTMFTLSSDVLGSAYSSAASYVVLLAVPCSRCVFRGFYW